MTAKVIGGARDKPDIRGFMTFFAEESPPMITSVSTEKDWKEEYRSRRAYAHLTDKQLCERYVSLLENMIEFDDSGSAFIARNSVPYWSKRLCWTEEEFRVRSLMNQAVELKQRELGRPRPQLVAGRKLLSSIELPELGSYIVKFSGSRYVKDMLADGRFRISLASSYNDPSLNPALRDDELTAERFLPAGTRLSVKLEGDYQEIPGIVGPLCHTSHCEDFYVFCAAGIFDPRLFDEFQADACLIVKDLHQFGLALIRGRCSRRWDDQSRSWQRPLLGPRTSERSGSFGRYDKTLPLRVPKRMAHRMEIGAPTAKRCWLHLRGDRPIGQLLRSVLPLRQPQRNNRLLYAEVVSGCPVRPAKGKHVFAGCQVFFRNQSERSISDGCERHFYYVF